MKGLAPFILGKTSRSSPWVPKQIWDDVKVARDEDEDEDEDDLDNTNWAI
jgi:hypothetical protein